MTVIKNIESSIADFLAYGALELTDSLSVDALSEFNAVEYYINVAYRENRITEVQAQEYFKRVEATYYAICNWRQDNGLGFVC